VNHPKCKSFESNYKHGHDDFQKFIDFRCYNHGHVLHVKNIHDV